MLLYSDKEIIEKVLGGDIALFKTIISKYKDTVAKTTFYILKNKENTEDVGQEVFINLYKNLSKYRGDASLKTYITKISVNLSLNKLKSLNSKKEKLFDYDSDFLGTLKVESNESNFDLKDLIKESLNSLKKEYREVIILKFIEGYSVKEISKMTDTKENTVLTRIHRGKKEMQILLKNFSSYV